MAAAQSSVSISELTDTLGSRIVSAESAISASMAAMGPDPSTVQMIKMQSDVARLSIWTSLTSGLIKELADLVKSVAQKTG
ncbi:EscF/YscF/HrpA family type III secretion system needle major subunit [Variovorax saccharolyticus]|uniref:EscF/YscF/HrpA family type III secretion system needle major subunit n=1 Tax=Variovorax saccharolyticus TaxID=3053516 RepID=UPI002576F48F|nr:EscF/YscF/HrpA family type III secretion system needle major subunit [Variovorax sp. J31P216]MDM0030178.1 EscF/YscF/HrpA family type III secretion system needle major subunit [Variovorax sp. J31P216]